MPTVEQLDWAHGGQRPKFHRVIRRSHYRSFDELLRLVRCWEEERAAIKGYKPLPNPESSLLQGFAFRDLMTVKPTKNSSSAIAEQDSVLSIKEMTSVPEAQNKPPDGNSKDSYDRKGGSGGNGTGNGTQKIKVQLKVEQQGSTTPAASTSRTNFPDSSPGASGEVTCFSCRQVGQHQKGCA